MDHVFQFLLLFFIYITLSNAADILQNPDFEIPPMNIVENETSQLLLLHNKQNPIPGWSFDGTVWYVTPAANLSLPGNGHAIQLGENGRINQTFKGTDDYSDYILTFTLAAQNENCFNNFTAVNISVLDPEYDDDRSRVFSLERNLSRQLWISYGFHLGSWGSKTDSINLEIMSVAQNLEQNVTCWPVVDNFIVNRNRMPRWYEGNVIANGDFEIGPAVIKNSSEGILVNEESSSYHTPLQQWKILGTVKYIDSKHFKVPRGNAAIELFSGYPSGIQADFVFQMEKTYTLNFTLGDADDSCVGDLLVFLQVGNDIRNYTVQSNGTGSANSRHSVSFSIASELSRDTSIAFYRFNETWTSDGVLCGPVLDNISLYMLSSNSSSMKMELWYGVVIFSLVLLGMMTLV
ncbi:protein BIIDXI-like [Primulina huaijiensis]|uniref:protein BIIDXI-like n=1 Tax=Primulina huaijiensis TaxID=1492673 RepID=UPI003CC76837